MFAADGENLQDHLQPASRPGARRTALDLATIALIVSALVGIAALGPSDTYAYAQAWNAGVGMGIVERGDWLLPRDQMGRVPRKPPLLSWTEAVVLTAIPARSDFVFRLPTILAGLASAMLVYLLGRRWFGRGTGLLSAGLWTVGLHMSKLLYVVTTDMLLTLWITSSIFCADRLLRGPDAEPGRGRWAVGLWASMILAALSKGWGIVNLPLVGGYVALVAALEPGFGELAGTRGLARLRPAAGLVLRRWGWAVRRVRLGWGLLAMALVLGPLFAAQLIRGGERFREVLKFEIWQRATGGGDRPPSASHVPPVLQLIYFAMPASIFAIGGLVLGLRKLVRPLCWTVAVVVPFSLTHGFRSDYLLPAYGAVAIMGAWAVGELLRRGPAERRSRAVRHLLAAVPVIMGLGLAAACLAYLLRGHLPGAWQKALPMPAWVRPGTWTVVAGLAGVGAVTFVLGVASSLRWRIGLLAWVTVAGMLGTQYFANTIASRHAIHPDGETIVAFSRQAGRFVGKDPFAVTWIGQLGPELYIGRFGLADANDRPFTSAEELQNSRAAWLIAADRDLVCLGAAVADPQSAYRFRKAGRYRTCPQDFGEVTLTSPPVRDRGYGRIHLIRLRRPFHLTGRPTKDDSPDEP